MSTEENKTSEAPKKPIFQDLNAEDPEAEPTIIESLCMNCSQNGTTKLLLTRIPHYKDVILMSFDCEHCGFQNNEIQSGGKINENGIKIELEIKTERDLNRQVVKSDHTSIKIPSLDFEIPSQSQKGEVTTVEGIIDRVIAGLIQDQPKRREENPDIAADLDLFIIKLKSLKIIDEPYTIIFEDITGECHVENPNAPQKDHSIKTLTFVRSEEQNKQLGIFKENNDELLKPIEPGTFPLEDFEGEVLTFPTNCPECNSPCSTNMKMTKIPHFKEVVIMATVCDTCGHRTNEVKSGSGIEPQGIKFEVLIQNKEDFSRDVLKSETCAMEIPELDFEVGPAALGGRFTTVEGLLTATRDQLISSTAFDGDSADVSAGKRLDEFTAVLDEIIEGKRSVTIVLDDPAGNSYVQSLADSGCDEKLKISKYDRSYQQNEELGINDMKVEGY